MSFNSFDTRFEKEYELAHGGQVRFKGDEVQSVQPAYENTLITLKNGKSYLLKYRDYGV